MYTIRDYIIKNEKVILNWKNKPSGRLYNAKYAGFAHIILIIWCKFNHLHLFGSVWGVGQG